MLNRLNIRIILVLFAIGVVLGIVSSLSRRQVTAAEPTTNPVVIVLPTAPPMATPAPGGAQTTDRARTTGLKASGNVISANQANLAFLIGGRIKQVHVKEGDRVKAGEVLAALDTNVLETQVAQAQALLNAAKATLDKAKAGPTYDDVALARSNLDRAKAAVDQAQAAYDRAGGAANPMMAMLPQSLNLQQATSAYQGAVAAYNLAVNHPTATELAAAEAQVAQAQLAFDQAKQNITNAELIAPFDGTIVWFSPHVGESALPGSPSVTVADLSKMQVQVNLDEGSLATIELDQPATVALDALGGKTLNGHVSKLGLLGTTAAGIVSVPVTIDIDPSDAPIYPGLSALVSFQPKP